MMVEVNVDEDFFGLAGDAEEFPVRPHVLGIEGIELEIPRVTGPIELVDDRGKNRIT